MLAYYVLILIILEYIYIDYTVKEITLVGTS